MGLETLAAIMLVGAIGGYLGGVVGAGIGATVVPGLILLGVSPAVAIGSSLLLHVLISPLGVLSYYKFRYVRQKIFLPLMLTGMLGSFLGATISTHLPKHELTILVGASTVIAGISIAVKFPRPRNRETQPKELLLKELSRRLCGPRSSSIILIGLVAGLAHGALGTGWGPMGVPLLILAGVLPKVAVGSSLFARFFVAIVGTSTYFALIGVQPDIVLPLLVGGSVAIIIGALTAKRLQSETLKRIVGIAAIVLGASVLFKQVIR